MDCFCEFSSGKNAEPLFRTFAIFGLCVRRRSDFGATGDYRDFNHCSFSPTKRTLLSRLGPCQGAAERCSRAQRALRGHLLRGKGGAAATAGSPDDDDAHEKTILAEKNDFDPNVNAAAPPASPATNDRAVLAALGSTAPRHPGRGPINIITYALWGKRSNG